MVSATVRLFYDPWLQTESLFSTLSSLITTPVHLTVAQLKTVSCNDSLVHVHN